jgi:hypothetical protein
MKAKGNGFIRVERGLWHSDHWRSLSANARVVLVDIQSGFTGQNNGTLTYGIGRAVKCLRCGKRTAIRTLAELKGAGLIEATSKGSFNHKAGARRGEATTWRLTYLPRTNPSKETTP